MMMMMLLLLSFCAGGFDECHGHYVSCMLNIVYVIGAWHCVYLRVIYRCFVVMCHSTRLSLLFVFRYTSKRSPTTTKRANGGTQV